MADAAKVPAQHIVRLVKGRGDRGADFVELRTTGKPLPSGSAMRRPGRYLARSSSTAAGSGS
jgi:hypothetical protein